MDICIYGSASNRIDDKYKKIVFEIGEKLALRGHKLIFGAGANGLMGAAARGFKQGKGEMLGIVPEFFKDIRLEQIFYESTEIIYTQEMYERKRLLEEKSESFIIVPGGIGTFDEFFAVLTNKQLGRHTKPIALFNAFGYYNPIIELMKHSTSEKFVTEDVEKIYRVFDENQIDEMIEYIETEDKPIDVSKLKDG